MTPVGAGILPQKLPSSLGKRIRCPKCGQLGILKVKEVPGKYRSWYYLYVYHYDPKSRKITWHYYGKLKSEGGRKCSC